MATQINMYVNTPFGQLHIFSDKEQTAKAERLIKSTPKILLDAYEDAAYRWGKRVVREAQRCVNYGIPPKGASWPPLSDKYVRNEGGDDRIYYKTGQYWEDMGLGTNGARPPLKSETIEYLGSSRTSKKYYIGLSNGVTKERTRTNRHSKRSRPTLQKVAKWLENGAGDIPPRPLWGPLYSQFGGKASIKRYVQNAIKRQLAKYM